MFKFFTMLIYILIPLIVSVPGNSLSPDGGTEPTDANRPERVVGGTAAPDGGVPHQVALRLPKQGNRLFCGGAIIDKRWIMTAAHCLVKVKPENIVAAAGTNQRTRGGTEYKISKFVIHGNYDRTSFANDIALMLTKEEIEFTEKAKPIKLASRNTEAGDTCLISGWGYTNHKGTRSPDKLQWLNVTTLSVKDCQNKLQPFQKKHPFTKKKICSLNKRGEGTCQGDSGGALMEKGEAVGVVSYNLPCAYGVPDVFTRVYAYLDWIKAKMDNNTT